MRIIRCDRPAGGKTAQYELTSQLTEEYRQQLEIARGIPSAAGMSPYALGTLAVSGVVRNKAFAAMQAIDGAKVNLDWANEVASRLGEQDGEEMRQALKETSKRVAECTSAIRDLNATLNKRFELIEGKAQ